MGAWEERRRRAADVDKRAGTRTGRVFPAEERTLSFHGALMFTWSLISLSGTQTHTHTQESEPYIAKTATNDYYVCQGYIFIFHPFFG